MPQAGDLRYLVKFLVASASFLFVGTVHGVLQVLPPIRAWLDSIGSPYGGPGHMLDPLAHAHINMVGGVVILCMAMTYYLLTALSGKPVHSRRMADHSFWWTAIGVIGFYITLLIFGTWEGHLMLNGPPGAQEQVHHVFKPVIAVVSTVMGMGFWIFFINVFLSAKDILKKHNDA